MLLEVYVILLLKRKTAKISSQQMFQLIQAAKNCSRKPQKIANQQKLNPATWYYKVSLFLFQ